MPKRSYKVVSGSAIMENVMNPWARLFLFLILAPAFLASGPPSGSLWYAAFGGLLTTLGSPHAAAQQPDTLSESQIRDIIRQSADRHVENGIRERDYTYIRRDEERKLDGKGRMKSTESETYQILVLGGETVERLIAKNDKPLSEKETRKEEEKIQKIVSREAKETDAERKKRLDKRDKEIEEGRKFVREIADAYNFRLHGIEDIEGRPAYVVDADPLPGYKPRLKDAKILPKFRFRVWIDKAERHWVKLDAECIDTVSWGLFLARLHKGSKVHVEQTRVNDEVWLPKHLTMTIDARIVLLKSMNLELDMTFRDYQKYRTDVLIRPIGETQ